MATAASVITPARFESGLTCRDFLAQATINVDRFERNYQNPVLTEDNLEFFREAAALSNGPRKLLAIAEAWCGDVCREIPTAARIAEAAGLESRIFPRDENPDIMDEFLSNNGKSRSIPVFVGDTKYITCFTEHSATAHAQLAQAMDEAKQNLGLPSSATLGNLEGQEKQALLAELIARIEPLADKWRRDAVKEMRQLLSIAHCGGRGMTSKEPEAAYQSCIPSAVVRPASSCWRNGGAIIFRTTSGAWN